jgi:YbbR domain-containing protein
MGDPLLQRIWRAATHNKRLKAASVALALLSWFIVHSIISHERLVREVPVSIRTDDGWAVLDVAVKSVNILFRGSQEDLRRLEQSPVRVEIDARRLAGGPHLLRLDTAHVLAAGAARPMYMDPPNVGFILDPQGEKRVAVRAAFQGEALEGVQMVQVRCDPATVMLHGPRRRLAEIEAVATVPIDLEGRSRPFRKTHVALVLSPDTWLANGTVSNITVEVTLAENVLPPGSNRLTP